MNKLSWFKKNKNIFSWALYDFGNSAFSTTVMAGFFPVFFKQYWSENADPTLSTARLGTAITIGSILVALISPFLGAIADHRGAKKKMCFLFMFFGTASCAWMAFIPAGDWFSAVLAYGIGMSSFSASCIFYDSLLPSIAPGEKANFASSLGFSLGYLGGGLLFTVNVLMYLKPELFGIASGVTAIKISFFSVAIWWFLFTLPLMKVVAEPVTAVKKMSLIKAFTSSGHDVLKMVTSLFKQKNLFLFLISYWLYIDGVYTVMTMAVDFGLSLGFKSSDLITALLIVQFIGFPASMISSYFADKWGCRVPILFSIVVYGITVIGSTYMSEPIHFYGLACIIGLAQGGVQALSRSMFSQMIPPAESGEYFAFFNLVGKFASILGPLLVGWGAYLMGSPQRGMLNLLILFIIGGALLFKVKEPQRT